MKRYTEYKESGIDWIGKVPIGWKIAKNRFVLTKVKNIVGNNEKDYPVLSLSIKGIIRKARDDNSGKIPTTYANYYQLIKKESLLLCLFDMDVTPCIVGYASEDGIVSPAYSSYVPFKLGSIVMRFYYYWYMRMQQEGLLLALSNNVRSSLSSNDFNALSVPIPPYDEQGYIVDYLERKMPAIDTVIADKQKMIELLKEKRNSVINEAVTKGLDPTVPMKDSCIDWIGDIPSQWAISRIGFESWVRARLGWKGLKAEEYVEDGYMFLATPNIKNIEIDFENVNYITKERYDESPEIKLSIDDVLLAKDGSTLGTVNVIRELPAEATVNSSIAVITPYKRLNSVFLFYLFQANCLTNVIQSKKGGMGVPHLFQGDIVKFYIPIPPIKEQQIIIKYLDKRISEIDSLIADISNQIDKIKEYRQSIISEAVTGKVAI